MSPTAANATRPRLSWLELYALGFGLFLGLTLLKFGNAVILNDKIIPPASVLKEKQAAQDQMQQAQQQAEAGGAQLGAPGASGAPASMPPAGPSPGRTLANGAPATDHFSPPAQGQ